MSAHPSGSSEPLVEEFNEKDNFIIKFLLHQKANALHV
jgi:hypothetical protein